jgi:hypothetical protein
MIHRAASSVSHTESVEGLAIGGQHKVNDYLTGLEVLFEDRYGVGDQLVVEQAGRDPLRAVVDHVGLFSTRLRDDTSTLHVPNGSPELVRNLSQKTRSAPLDPPAHGGEAQRHAGHPDDGDRGEGFAELVPLPPVEDQ